MSYALRPATAEDLPFAWALYRDLMHDLTVELLLPWNDEAQRAVVCTGIEAGAVRIVEVDGRPVGWIQVNDGPEALELGQLYLDRGWQGRGLGTRLIRAVQEQARAAHKPVTLSVMRNNPRALALYERLGFVEAGRDAYKLHLRWKPGGT
jgi:ribosomal protein S18 acetylase RimI-like enzyme